VEIENRLSHLIIDHLEELKQPIEAHLIGFIGVVVATTIPQ